MPRYVDIEPFDSDDLVITEESNVLDEELVCKYCCDLPDADVVERNELEYVSNRLKHLLESSFIRSFDEIDFEKKDYIRDIAEVDRLQKDKFSNGCPKIDAIKLLRDIIDGKIEIECKEKDTEKMIKAAVEGYRIVIIKRILDDIK